MGSPFLWWQWLSILNTFQAADGKENFACYRESAAHAWFRFCFFVVSILISAGVN